MGLGPAMKSKILRNGLRAWAGGAIVLLLFLTPLLNYQVLQGQDSLAPSASSDGQRSLASVDASWELKISEEAASLLKKELVRGGVSIEDAGIGRRPDAYDRLAFGVLEGKYQFHLENGKIKEIDLVDQRSARAKLSEPSAFLTEFKDLLLVSYSKTQQRKRFLDHKNMVTIYDLMNSDNTRVGQVSFIEDQDGGLQKVTVKYLQ
jgi:hypothetical protein